MQYTYQNNRITNIGYTYDADGRSLTSWDGNGAEASYDASGKMYRILYWNASDIYRYNDGNGRESKRKTTRWITDANGAEYWSETPKYTYFIRSSVLGNEVVSEVDGTGRKEQTIVRAGGSELAIQGVRHHNNNSFEFVQFKHIDASGVSIRSTDAVGNLNGGWGTEFEPAELDPLGGNVGFSTPYVELIPNPPSDLPDWSYLWNESPMRVDGQIVKFTVDGMSLPVSMNRGIIDRLRNGSLVPEHINHLLLAQAHGFLPDDINISFDYVGGGLFKTSITGLAKYLDYDSITTVQSFGGSWSFNQAVQTQTIQQEREFNVAVTTVRSILGSKNPCSEFFGSNALAAFNNMIRNKTFERLDNANVGISMSIEIPPFFKSTPPSYINSRLPIIGEMLDGAKIYEYFAPRSFVVNTAGPFFNNARAPDIDGYSPGSLGSRVIQLLHELGHVTITGFTTKGMGDDIIRRGYVSGSLLLPPDGQNADPNYPRLSQANTETVLQHCRIAIINAVRSMTPITTDIPVL